MRRIVLWLMSTLSAVVLLLGYHTSTTGAMSASTGLAPVTSGAQGGSSGATSSTGNGNSGSGSGAGGGSGGTSSSGAGSGSGSSAGTPATITGETVDTQWGPVQVQLTVEGGTITRVSVPIYPSGNGTDQQINAYALPILVRDTLDAQSADIAMVSGATVTSTGYLQSLQSALDQASL